MPLKAVILKRANHFKSLYELLIRLDIAFSDPAPPLPFASGGPVSFSGLLNTSLFPTVTSEPTAKQAVDQSLAGLAQGILDSIEEDAKTVGLVRTLSRVAHFKAYLESQATALTLGEPHVEAEIRALREALDDDFKSRFVFFPDEEKLRFSVEIIKTFDFDTIQSHIPDAAYELSYAGRCYSTDNDPACVYHAMNAAEYGLRALAQRFHLAKHLQASWGTMIHHLRKRIEKLQPHRKTKTRVERLEFFSQLLDQCVFFNEHWRKRSAHVPPRYRSAEALNALNRSGEFIKLLAENGLKLPHQVSGE